MTEAEIKAFRALLDETTAAPWRPWGANPDDPDIEHPGIEADRGGGGEGVAVVLFGYGAGDDGGVRGETPEAAYANARFIAAARNVAARLCDAALYALEFERVVHDIQRGEAADLIAEARRQGREEVIDLLAASEVRDDQGLLANLPAYVRGNLPSLPAEPPTNHELRTRAAALEAENARLREALERIGSDRTHTAKDARNEARKALGATP